VIAGLGQGFNIVTPIQLASALAALANGGTRYAPRLLFASKSTGNDQAKMILAPVVQQIPVNDRDNWGVIRDGMTRVVHGTAGTARALQPVDGYRIAGKSGTAQVVALPQNDDDSPSQLAQHLRHHALFMAYAPADRPDIAVAVVVEHGGGGSTQAAPVARAVIEAWLSQELER
jgi:penicillin-binding protein 2